MLGKPNLDIDVEQGMVTSTELKISVKAVQDRLNETLRPMVVTVDGKTGFVAMSPKLFEMIKVALQGETNR